MYIETERLIIRTYEEKDSWSLCNENINAIF